MPTYYSVKNRSEHQSVQLAGVCVYAACVQADTTVHEFLIQNETWVGGANNKIQLYYNPNTLLVDFFIEFSGLNVQHLYVTGQWGCIKLARWC